jgi:hypothetical protein
MTRSGAPKIRVVTKEPGIAASAEATYQANVLQNIPWKLNPQIENKVQRSDLTAKTPRTRRKAGII